MSTTHVAERPAANVAPRSNAEIVFNDKLLARRGQIAAALKGSGIPVDQFIRAAQTCVLTNPSLVTDVDFQSLWLALLKACRDQLLPDGIHGAIVPYKRQAVWIPMVRGMIDRFQRSGQFKWIFAGLHRTDDVDWDVWVDELGQHFLHRQGPGEGEIIETYAAAIAKSGGFFLTVISEPDMNHIRASSRATSPDAPWNQWPDQMRLKSALRRLCKLLPMPQPLDDMMRDDEATESGKSTLPGSQRPRGVAALEHFGEHGEREPPDDAAKAGQDAPATDAPVAEPVPRVRIETAHERGKQARADKLKRTDMPTEYCDAARGQELAAWLLGFDGKPLPPQDTGGGHDAQQ